MKTQLKKICLKAGEFLDGLLEPSFDTPVDETQVRYYEKNREWMLPRYPVEYFRLPREMF